MSKLKTFILVFIKILLFAGISFSQDLIPDCILDYKLGNEKYILIVDKSTQILHVYSNHHLKPVKSYKITTGKNRGIKIIEGDKKTPEGVYLFKRVIAEKDLPKIDDYGMQAFTTNYPNPIDRKNNRNGSGIWLHGANNASKIKTPFNTRGCVVMNNTDLVDVSKYIFLNKTVLCIYKKIIYKSPQELSAKRRRILGNIMAWKTAWENKSLDGYIGFYSNFFNQKGMNLSQYKQYKKRLNSKYKFISVILSNISLYAFQDYWVSMFDQLYISDLNQFNSIKVQYWQENPGGNKIIDSINFSLPQVNRFRDAEGNFISIKEFRQNFLHKIKSDLKLFSYPQVLLENISRVGNQIIIDYRVAKIQEGFSIIPVLHLKKGEEQEHKTIPGIILKDSIPQSFENSILINKKYLESSISVQKEWKIECITLYIVDPEDSFVQVNRFYVNK